MTDYESSTSFITHSYTVRFDPVDLGKMHKVAIGIIRANPDLSDAVRSVIANKMAIGPYERQEAFWLAVEETVRTFHPMIWKNGDWWSA